MPEITVVLGYPASGKSTVVKEFVDKGFHRVNRDEIGGSLDDLIPHVASGIDAGKNVVLDNTYSTRASRKSLLDFAKSKNIPVNCVWLQTSFEDSQLNACLRMMERVGKIMMPEDFKGNKDPNLFPPAVLFKYKKEITAKEEINGKKVKINVPSVEEGFAKVEKRKFNRIWSPEYVNSAAIYDADGTLRESTGKEPWPLVPDDVVLIDGAKEHVHREAKANDFVFGISNQSTHEKKEYKTPLDVIDSCFDRTNDLLDYEIPWFYCPHYRFPVQCYCRKPQCGLGAYLIYKFKLDPSKCTYYGDNTTDKTFAKRCGFNFVHVSEMYK